MPKTSPSPSKSPSPRPRAHKQGLRAIRGNLFSSPHRSKQPSPLLHGCNRLISKWATVSPKSLSSEGSLSVITEAERFAALQKYQVVLNNRSFKPSDWAYIQNRMPSLKIESASWTAVKNCFVQSASELPGFELHLSHNKFTIPYPDIATPDQINRMQLENDKLNELNERSTTHGLTVQLLGGDAAFIEAGLSDIFPQEKEKMYIRPSISKSVSSKHNASFSVGLELLGAQNDLLSSCVNDAERELIMKWENLQYIVKVNWLYGLLLFVVNKAQDTNVTVYNIFSRVPPNYFYYGWYLLNIHFYPTLIPSVDSSRDTFGKFRMNPNHTLEQHFARLEELRREFSQSHDGEDVGDYYMKRALLFSLPKEYSNLAIRATQLPQVTWAFVTNMLLKLNNHEKQKLQLVNDVSSTEVIGSSENNKTTDVKVDGLNSEANHGSYHKNKKRKSMGDKSVGHKLSDDSESRESGESKKKRYCFQHRRLCKVSGGFRDSHLCRWESSPKANNIDVKTVLAANPDLILSLKDALLQALRESNSHSTSMATVEVNGTDFDAAASDLFSESYHSPGHGPRIEQLGGVTFPIDR